MKETSSRETPRLPHSAPLNPTSIIQRAVSGDGQKRLRVGAVSELNSAACEDVPGQRVFVRAAASVRVASNPLALRVVEIHRRSEAPLVPFP